MDHAKVQLSVRLGSVYTVLYEGLKIVQIQINGITACLATLVLVITRCQGCPAQVCGTDFIYYYCIVVCYLEQLTQTIV